MIAIAIPGSSRRSARRSGTRAAACRSRRRPRSSRRTSRGRASRLPHASSPPAPLEPAGALRSPLQRGHDRTVVLRARSVVAIPTLFAKQALVCPTFGAHDADHADRLRNTHSCSRRRSSTHSRSLRAFSSPSFQNSSTVWPYGRVMSAIGSCRFGDRSSIFQPRPSIAQGCPPRAPRSRTFDWCTRRRAGDSFPAGSCGGRWGSGAS